MTTSIGELPRNVQARLVGVPPNISVSTTHARALIDALNGFADLFARRFDIVVPADGNGGDVMNVFVDDGFRRADQFRGQISVRHHHASD